MTTITSEIAYEWLKKNGIIGYFPFSIVAFKYTKWPIGKTNESVCRWITRDGKILRSKPENPEDACLVNVDGWNKCRAIERFGFDDIVENDALSAFFFFTVSNMLIQPWIAHTHRIGLMKDLSPENLAYNGNLAWCLANPGAVASDSVCKMLTELSGESAVMPDGSFSEKYREAYLSVYRGESRPSGMNYDLEAVELFLSVIKLNQPGCY